nr:MAG TPA: Protein of unknown function (DUF2570) [Caudoviricetes sp.]
MRIALFISVWLLIAAAVLNFWNLREQNKVLMDRMETLQQAVEQRDQDLKQAEEAWQQKKGALDEMEKQNPDFYNQPLPDGSDSLFGKGSGPVRP